MNFFRRLHRSLERKKARPFTGDAFYYHILTLIVCLSILVLSGLVLVGIYGAGQLKANRLSSMMADENSFDNLYFSDRIFDGVAVSGYPVGGKTKAQAKEFLSAYVTDMVESPRVTVSYQGKVWRLDSDRFLVEPDLDSAVEEAWKIGRSGTAQEREDTYKTLKASGINISANAVSNTEYIAEILTAIKEQVDVEKKNASVSFSFNNGPVYTYTDEVRGVDVDVEAETANLCKAIAEGSGEVIYELQPVYHEPEIKRADLEKPYTLVGTYSTYLAAAQTGRRQNIQTALASFNQYVWMPEETLSFNQLVGERTAEKGFADGVYINSQQLYDETLGGGICQVSTTLYYCSLLCGANVKGVGAPIEIVERNPHTWPSSYIAKGLDASVNWPSADLRLRNNSQTPYFIRTYMGKTSVNVEIYGMPLPDGAKITTETEVIETIRPGADEYIDDTTNKYKLAPGEKKKVSDARTGYTVVTYQIWTVPGQQPIKTVLNRSYYKAVPAKYYVGVA